MKSVYISIPISGYDLDERKAYAYNVKHLLASKLQNNAVHRDMQLNYIMTPFDVCSEPDKPYSYYMGKDIEALLECDVIYLCEGWQTPRVVWQSLRWQEFTVKK